MRDYLCHMQQANIIHLFLKSVLLYMNKFSFMV